METVVDYSVSSKHLTSKIAHELLFSIVKKRFMIPYRHDKNEGKLVYKLMPGRYLKFSLFALASADSATFRMTWVNVNEDGSVNEKTIYEVEARYTTFIGIIHDANAPQILSDFIRMVPEYHKTAYVSMRANYETVKDVDSLIESIKRYLERRMISQ
jgi:hypothetical protein